MMPETKLILFKGKISPMASDPIMEMVRMIMVDNKIARGKSLCGF